MNRTKPISVFLYIDSLLVRKWVERQLISSDGIEVVGHAQDAIKALNSIGKLQPDAVIMLSRDRKSFGIDIQQYIRNSSPRSKVIMLASSMHHIFLRDSVHAEADTFLDGFAKWKNIPDILTGYRAERSEKNEFRSRRALPQGTELLPAKLVNKGQNSGLYFISRF